MEISVEARWPFLPSTVGSRQSPDAERQLRKGDLCIAELMSSEQAASWRCCDKRLASREPGGTCDSPALQTVFLTEELRLLVGICSTACRYWWQMFC